ncbi:filamentous hemagglutinin family protein [Bordetella ansorpii]|nr:filamentous hemagglutinin family protein [Bordetella ansorpii]
MGSMVGRDAKHQSGLKGGGALRLAPVALALAAAAGGFIGHGDAQAQAWFAASGSSKGAGFSTDARARAQSAGVGVGNGTAAQQAAARQKLDRSIGNLNVAAQAIAAQQAAQAAARDAAVATGGGIPDGLIDGGLKVDSNALTAGWRNAQAPVKSVANGKTTVTVQQTGDRAILNWETFNVGRNTTVDFRQQADWAVLNRVNDPQARPSQIEGTIRGDGTVMVVNRNGIVFGGGAQVDVRNLVAAAAKIGDQQFIDRGIYGTDSTVATFTEALGKIEVHQGAQIRTTVPATVTQGGGYTLLLGKDVEQAGTIHAPRGQALLAAGDSFVIRRGQGSEGNLASTTRGSEVLVSGGGTVRNTGLIQSPLGDVTLAANQVEQAGVLATTTSVDARGTIHLTATGADSAVTLREGAVNAILLDASTSTALDGQRDSLLAPSQVSSADIQAADRYRRDLSLVQIDSAGSVDFQTGTLTLATGGQVAARAGTRTLVRDGAQIDVSGAIGVPVSMESNNLKINIQGNEQRDAPGNRDSGKLANSDAWVDIRDLVYVPAGTGGYDSARWYTKGGLLEVGGYLSNRSVPASHWLAQGGLVRFDGGEVVTQAGSLINLSGGTLDVQSGRINMTWLRGEDGRLYTADRAPGDLLYKGVYRGYEAVSARWGEDATRYYYNPLIAPTSRFEPGYTVGRDAGTLVVSTASAVLEGRLVGETFQGARQTEAPLPEAEGYGQSHGAQSRPGQLVVGDWRYYYDARNRTLVPTLGATSQNIGRIVVEQDVASIAQELDLSAALPDNRKGVLRLDTALLDQSPLGAIRLAAREHIAIDATLNTAAGGSITLYAPQVDIRADVVSRGGSIQAGNVLNQPNGQRIENVGLAPQAGQATRLDVAEGVRLDASGLWSDGLDGAQALAASVHRHGGSVSLQGTGDVGSAEGSVIDVSAGGVLLPDGRLLGGRGGSVTLAANVLSDKTLPVGGRLAFDGQVQGFGIAGGGTLSVASAGVIVLGGQRQAAQGADALWLDAGLFQAGFAQYTVNGHGGVTVAEDAAIDVAMPVYRKTSGQTPAPGAARDAALSLWTPPLYDEDPAKAVLTQRQGASLTLRSERNGQGGAIEVSEGARVAVDPGQSITLRGADQMTVLGSLVAPGGRISIDDVRPDIAAFDGVANAKSVWIGEHAVLDVAGRSHVAMDRLGRRYGIVQDGGSIEIGGTLNWETGSLIAHGGRYMDRHLILRPGALLDASGTQAVLDLPGRGATTVASQGGNIILASANSLYLDGRLRAAAGGAQAAGGLLGVALGGAFYFKNSVSPEVLPPRSLMLSQVQGDSVLGEGVRAGDSDPALAYGTAALGVDRIQAGGFGSLSLFATTLIQGDVDLSLPQSLRLVGVPSVHDDAPAGTSLRLAAPHLFLDAAGFQIVEGGDSYTYPSEAIPGLTTGWLKRGHQARLDADLIDLRGALNFNHYDDVLIASRGDIRLHRNIPVSTGDGTLLSAPNTLTVVAAQLYPVTGAAGGITVGYGFRLDNVRNPDAVLTLRRADGTLPDQPYSAFGVLSIKAPTIEQGGVLRAPLGQITVSGTDIGPSKVSFLPGSVTSVSAVGLDMPYGGTADGINYRYAGAAIDPTPAGGRASDDRISRRVAIDGVEIAVEPGAVLDLSGGGELRGAAFVSGRGGSIDILAHAMADSNPAMGFASSGNGVYAIVPSFQGAYAPVVAESGAGLPAVGRQVTIEHALPGLAAGTYTLLPSSYALLPGAFRVEIGAAAPHASAVTARTRGGSLATQGFLGTAHTGQRNALANTLLVTPAAVVRRHAQYNETSYAQFLLADAARRGIPRAMLPADAATLTLTLGAGAGMNGRQALRVDGEARFAPAAGSAGYGGTLTVSGAAEGIEVLAPGQSPILGERAAAVSASALNALAPVRMVVGGALYGTYGSGRQGLGSGSDGGNVIVRNGVTLQAAEIVLASGAAGRIVVEPGATLSTLRQGAMPMDARNGLLIETQGTGALVVSNGDVTLLPPSFENATRIELGACLSQCEGMARIVSEGSIAVATNGVFSMGEAVEYGTRNLMLSVSSLNLGSTQSLAAAQAAGVLPPGMAMSQDVLDRLLRGNTALGTPALESLILTAGESVNVFGSMLLDTRVANGASSLQRLVLGAPAIHGYGAADDTATIRANELVWAGSLTADPATGIPGYDTPAAPGGAVLDRLGDGTLAISADVIRFDAAPYRTATSLVPANRLVLGFSALTLDAATRITAQDTGSLAVHHAVDGYEAGRGWQYRGGDIVVRTPLLTAEAGAVLDVRASGALTVRGTGAAPGTSNALGGSLSLAARRISLDTTVALPSGKLTLDAQQDIVLGDAAHLDLAGREIVMHDVKQYSWGGDLVMKSAEGDITQAAGSVIDLSARYNRGGRLQASALGASAGYLDLAGAVLGSASGLYDAGGTYVPYDAAEITLRAQTLADFQGLNTRLNDGGAFGARRFQVKQGDLTVGDEVRARHVEIVADGGSLTVNGRIDASGVQVGSIYLAAQRDLTINGQLDAHGTHLRRDSYGKIIDSPNRAIIDLTSRQGTLALGAGASFDLRAGTAQPERHDGVMRGTLDLNVLRTGGNDARGALAGSGDGANGVALNVAGTPVIQGAGLVAVNAFRRYTDAPLAAELDINHKRPQLISQGYFGNEEQGIHKENLDFMQLASGNAALGDTLSRLGARLRPGVEIASATADGDLTVVGDLDLSGYRYGPHADISRRGFGEPGVLVLRAGGNLNIHGSINDGFAPPPDTPDDKEGWLLVEGRYNPTTGQTPFGGDLVIPVDSVTLDTGTVFPAGRALNYDLPAQAATLPAGTELPVGVTLAGELALSAGLVLTGQVTLADGTVLAAGTVLQNAVTLGSGAQLGAGFRLRSAASVQAFTWPKGIALPTALTARGQIVLARGAIIPSQTKVELPGDAPVNLRPVDSDGTQGRNWAVAPMLPAGATSWDLTLVAGSDLESADVRSRNALGTGDIVLADTHYGRLASFTRRTIIGGDMRLSEAAAIAYGVPELAGKTAAEAQAWFQETYGMGWMDWFGESFEDFCSHDGGNCTASSGPRLTQAWVDANAMPELLGMTYAEAENWFQTNYQLGWMDWFGISFEDSCATAGFCVGDAGSEPEVITEYAYRYGTPSFSVLRTGTGDLSMAAGRDVGMMSVYGVYTAGTPTSVGAADARFELARGGVTEGSALGPYQDSGFAEAMSVYRAWYPDQGGNLTVSAGRDVYGDAWGDNAQNGVSYPGQDWSRQASSAVGNWLWRQGGQDIPGVQDIATSWWINFGTYANRFERVDGQPRLVGFTGFGTLGGGNLSLSADRHAGVREARGDALVSLSDATPRSQGLVAAVGSSGRVVDGELVLTGGGDLDLRIGGALNPNVRATQQSDGATGNGGAFRSGGGSIDHLDLNGVLTNLRGNLTLSAGKVGAVSRYYGDGAGLRASDPFALSGGLGMGGPVLMLGDAPAWLQTRGDLVLAGTGDPGRTQLLNTTPYGKIGAAEPESAGGESWFSLWTGATAVNLLSAGGNLVPISVHGNYEQGSNLGWEVTHYASSSTVANYYIVYPSVLRAVAADGNVILPVVPTNLSSRRYTLMLAPSASGELSFLAGGSVLANGGPAVTLSGADATLPNPLRPAFASGLLSAADTLSNTSKDAIRGASNGSYPLFVFGPNSPQERALHAGDGTPARFYAVDGDVVGVKAGSTTSMLNRGYQDWTTVSLAQWFEAATPLAVRAGRDILDFNGIALHNNASDVSVVQAGRDIVHAGFTVAGPGAVVLQAGRQFRQDDVASVRSLGPLVRGDTRPGASIAVLAGVGAAGPDYTGFLARYLDAANAMTSEPGNGLDSQPGRVAQTYGGELTLAGWLRAQYGYAGTTEDAPAELARRQALRDADTEQPYRSLAEDYRQESQLYLVNWLRDVQGYEGDADGARAALEALAPAQRESYARQLFFAELRKGGREYNDEAGPRFGSYLRGRRAVSAFFPEMDAQGRAVSYGGDFTMYGGAGLHTDFGGGIQVLTPGGLQLVGLEGEAPPSTAGVVTQGRGDIEMYAQSSILLGQSRIMTTFGGHVLAWSAEGDINAGRGAKTTVVYTPPRRVYDAVGNVALSPTVPSSGAGIATLNPIPEVPAGDVDLIAPLGTIDAGEAGIRVSGNVNIAALQVVNAANIQVQGESKGIPVVAAVNVGALTSASAAATSAATSAQDAVARSRAAAQKALPSIISVQVLGFGNEPASRPALPPGGSAPRAVEPSADAGGRVRVLGHGDTLRPELMAHLTDEQRRLLAQER